MAEGNALVMKEIKAMDVIDFYLFYDQWIDKIKKKNQQIKNNGRR